MRVRLGEVLAAAGGAVLLGSLFTEWYGARARAEGASGWQSFDVVDLYLTLVALLAFALLVAQARRSPAVPVTLSVLTFTAALLALLVVTWRLIDQPGPNEFITVSQGAWIGFDGVLLVLVGTFWSMADERPRSEPPGPEPELRPAPPAT
jgi:hypothetical protein